ncbi:MULTISPECIES: transcription repressor NadR [Megasphaera]|uniref:3H domain protein n=1 Tax=Megasphaera vaginalis (ex Srinivasan et al. 2021) TaxID=1111454 RepID=U7UH09_9FIRM|nr:MULTISPECIES: transcription repressor NadR [Megasphaera]ERT58149.1 3H domain protein [Megasphaera vaginalis (ex Srinivasan et al. 2021)]
MDGEERRQEIVRLLSSSPNALTGTALSRQCQVSRQIIVGDVAVLRAQGVPIISTPRGYQMLTSAHGRVRRVFVCCHGADKMRQELEAIVDNGGIVHNVVIEHDVYGNLEGSLHLRSRRDVNAYLQRMAEANAELLSKISGGIHTHLVEAATEGELRAIEAALRRSGVLYED